MLNKKEFAIVVLASTLFLLLVSVLAIMFIIYDSKPQINYTKEANMADFSYGDRLSRGKQSQTIAQRAPKIVTSSVGTDKKKAVKKPSILDEANEYYKKHNKYKNAAQRKAVQDDIAKRKAKLGKS